jgi:hypothetical protein
MFDDFPWSYVPTRIALHSLAEHVLCVVGYQSVGRVGLIPIENGIASPAFGPTCRQVAVIGSELVDTDDSGERREPVSTVRAAARFFDVTPGIPGDLWHPVTSPDLDAPLVLDPDSLAVLHRWFGLAVEAHRRFAAKVVNDDVPAPTLWPEHLDLATTVGAANFGASPGDDSSDEPYLYVGPHDRPFPGPAEFWNRPYGAALRAWAVDSIDTAVAFMELGYRIIADDGSWNTARRLGERPSASPGRGPRSEG